jgi:MFS family permease
LPIALAILPLVGLALNGTSSVLYGSVPELVAPAQQSRAFGIFYTAGVGAGAISPVVSGAISDAYGLPHLMVVLAALAVTTIPLAIVLQSRLRTAT